MILNKCHNIVLSDSALKVTKEIKIPLYEKYINCREMLFSQKYMRFFDRKIYCQISSQHFSDSERAAFRYFSHRVTEIATEIFFNALKSILPHLTAFSITESAKLQF